MTNGRPIEFHPTPPGTPSWGLRWKQAVARHYNHTVVPHCPRHRRTPTRRNYLDLDPTYKDAWGLPLLRMTFDFPDNDIRMSKYVTEKAVEIGRAMGGKIVAGLPRQRPYTTTVYQTTHNTGGAIMGSSPATSVVNRYLQSWDVPNVFVVGASAYAAQRLVQSDQHGRRPDLLGARRDQEQVSEVAGTAGACMRGAGRNVAAAIGGITILCLGLHAAVLAQGNASDADTKRGAVIAAQGVGDSVPACAPCHALNGIADGSGAFPRIAGQSAFYLARQMRRLRVGRARQRHHGADRQGPLAGGS